MSATVETSELLRLVRSIRIRTRKMVSELLAGSYRSAFRGGGLEPDEVRAYAEGDDLRTVDWNVTARTGSPFVKTYREERERTVIFLVDVSASTGFGSGTRTKAAMAAEFCAVLALSASASHDKVGLTAFTDRIEHQVPPRKGTRHALRVVRDILSLQSLPRKTRIGAALDQLGRISVKRAVVFLISDFRDAGFEPAFKAAARRHDLTAVRVVDPRERELPAAGLIRLRDPETGGTADVDLASAAVRQRFAAAAEAREQGFRSLCVECGAGHLAISTDEPLTESLRTFMQRRERRLRR